jgi:phosphatidylserine/phosphatidylglycerophosphate/cardiolipin synthase-like enzyme
MPLDRGFSNSAAITAVLNRSVAGKSGMAIRDRSTRQLGSFHQKAVVLVKRDPTTFPDGNTRHRVFAYVGGIDLAHGRWDTDEHHHLDPERQEGSGWRDVQIKIEGDATLDVLKNFTQRWQALIDFDSSSPCKPANVVNNMNKPFKVPTHVRAFDEPGPLVQITRTWPPASCHASLPIKPFIGQNGEFGSLESYLKAIRRAKKFILINDQYLFGVEIAQAIREALLRPDGPECVMILLPMNLSEVEIVDPVIYKARRRAIDTLFYGATFEGGVTPGPNEPHRYKINPTTGPSLRDRIAIVTPVNRRGDEIYVHSKTMVVDDAFMTIGSANFTFRGTTYEMEINAAVVDRTLQQGGGVAVREQRIEFCRRMLGLPASYAAMMQDWNACFHMFKALETETAPVNPEGASSPGTVNLHPLPPMIKALPPGFAPKLGAEHQAFNAGVSFVMDLDNNSSGMLWLVNNALDVDGRDTVSDQMLIDGAQLFTNIKYLYDDTPYLSEFPHNPPSPYGRLTFDLNPVKAAMITVVDGGDTLSLILRIHMPEGAPPEGEPPEGEPREGEPEFSTELGRFAVTLDSSPNRNIVIATMTGSQLLVPIHVARQVDVIAELRAGGGIGAMVGAGSHAFNPPPGAGGEEPVTNGVFIGATIALAPPP